MQTEPHLPADPVDRLLQLTRAIEADKRWFQGWGMLRYAAAGLLTIPGEASEQSSALFSVADELKDSARWFSTLKSDVRYCIAAGLMRYGYTVAEFNEVLEVTRSYFRDLKLPRGDAQEVMACLVLMNAALDGRPSREQAEGLVSVYEGMKAHHRMWTGRDDYPAAALLASTGDSLDAITKRVEALYEGLRDLSFKRGNQLQLASHLLYFAPDADEVILARFRDLYAGFKQQGLWMNSGDYDEIAILAFLDHEPQKVIAQLLDDRERLRRDMPSAPSRQEGFTLATSTTFLHLVTHDRQDERIVDALQMAQVLALLQAQQTAAVVVASTAATSAAASH